MAKKTKRGAAKGPLAKIPKALRNRYVLTFAVFAIYIGFFDHYSLLKQYELRETLQDLQREQAQYAKSIEESNELRLTIEADEERFARERYYMKRSNEDVYIIEESTE